MSRFTLRQEYFGGILHDTQETVCHELSPTEFELLRQIVATGKLPDFQNESEVNRFIALGAVKSEAQTLRPIDVRYVEPPQEIPQHCLTAPIRVYHTFTRTCNLECPQCCVTSNANITEDRMTMKQLAIVMKKFYDVGTMEWRFTGGEPTSSPNFLSALEIAKGLGMAVMVNTNGCWSDMLLERLPEAGINEVIVSLEGNEKINDERRAPGVFQNIKKLLKRIAEHNRLNPDRRVNMCINMTVGRDNVDQVPFIVRLGASYGYNVNFVPLRPFGRTLTNMVDNMLSTEEFMEFSRTVQELREEPAVKNSGNRIIHRNMDLFSPDYLDKSDHPYPFNYSDCGALTTGLGVCPDGRVNSCSFLMSNPNFLGPSLLEVSAYEAWMHPSMEYFRQAHKVGCPSCPYYMKQCEGKCRAMVLANGGRIENKKLVGIDPYCFRHQMLASLKT